MQDQCSISPALCRCVGPVVCFNRVRSAVGQVLWPVAHIHAPTNTNFVGNFAGAETVPFANRKPGFVWRGEGNGAIWSAEGANRRLTARSLIRLHGPAGDPALIFTRRARLPTLDLFSGFTSWPGQMSD